MSIRRLSNLQFITGETYHVCSQCQGVFLCKEYLRGCCGFQHQGRSFRYCRLCLEKIQRVPLDLDKNPHFLSLLKEVEERLS